MCSLRGVLFGIVLAASSTDLLAERYRVVEDSFGNFDASPEKSKAVSKDASPLPTGPAVKSDETPSSQDAELIKNIPNAASSVQAIAAPTDNSTSLLTDAKNLDSRSADSVVGGVVGSAVSGEGVEDSSSTSNQLSSASDIKVAELELGAEPELVAGEVKEEEPPQRVLGVFERAFLENEGANPYDATVVDESDFVDGDALLEGRVEREGEQPFFITRDVEGNESVTFYSPSLAQKARADSNKKLKFSKSTIYKESDNDGVYVSDLPSGADPIAVHILSAGKGVFENYFDAFGKRCCQLLPKAGIKVLSFERSQHLKVERESLPYRFNEGDSRYLIFKLPDSLDNFAIQLRAFIRRFKDQNIKHGVFYPQLVMLDAEMRPLRIIADPVLDYTPENWSGYGYLQGVFEVYRTEGNEEVYVMLNTTKDHLRKVSQYDTEGGIEIRHMRYGELGVKALYANSVEP